MAIMTFPQQTQRIGRFKGEILKHVVFEEVLAKQGRQIKMPKNVGDTYVARRWMPYGALSTNANTQNRFFQDGTGDRGQTIVTAHQVQEGVTPIPESIVPMDVTVTIQQYSCLYGYTDKMANLYEDDVPKEMTEQVGQRVGLVNEMIVYGVLRSSTNVYYGGAGTSIATVNGGLTLNLIRRIVKNLQANHAKPVNKMLSASANYGTDAVAAGFTVYTHTDLEPDIRDLPGFIPVEKYATGKPLPGEVGKVERLRFITSPDLPSIQDGGAAVGATGLSSTSGTSIDVYPIIVVGQDAWSQLAVRGMESLSPTHLRPSEKTKSDPHGQRGYVGTIWWKAAFIENHGWMAVAYVGSKALS